MSRDPAPFSAAWIAFISGKSSVTWQPARRHCPTHVSGAQSRRPNAVLACEKWVASPRNSRYGLRTTTVVANVSVYAAQSGPAGLCVGRSAFKVFLGSGFRRQQVDQPENTL